MYFKPVTVCLPIILFIVCCFTLSAQGSPSAPQKALTIAVAANFHQTLKKIVHAYQSSPQSKISQIQLQDGSLKQKHKNITLVAASSGQLYHQIKQGAPYHLFLSATPIYIKALQKAGLTAQDIPPIQFAVGQLALWAPAAENTQQITHWLLHPEKHSHKLALANPQLAPFGLAAQQTLMHLSLKTRWTPRTVRAMNANQTYHYVYSHAVKMGFTSLAHLKQNNIPAHQYWVVPNDHHKPITQESVILKHGQSLPIAQDFFNYLQNTESQQIILNAGHQLPVRNATPDAPR